MPRAITGKELRDGFLAGIEVVTLGIVRAHGNSLRLGPFELLRFGNAKVSRSRVQWPVEGGLATGAPGGSLRIEAGGGRLVSSLEGYRPRLPRPLYAITQLPIHHLTTRLHLLRVRGRRPEPGVPAAPANRLAAGAIDLALCAAIAATTGRRRRLPAFLGIAAGYHVACWTFGGRTLGGVVMRQRVVAVDGSTLSAGQALVRLAALPVAALRGRAVHDDAAGTEVIES